jgi:hypothetical protein
LVQAQPRELRLELFARSPRRDGPVGNLEQHGDFGGGHFLDFEEDEHAPEVEVHRIEHAVEKRARATLIEQIVGASSALNIRGRVSVRNLSAITRATPNVRCNAHRRPQEKALLAAEHDRAEATRGDYEHLLRRIVGAVVAETQATQRPPDEVEMRVEHGAQTGILVGASWTPVASRVPSVVMQRQESHSPLYGAMRGRRSRETHGEAQPCRDR